MQTANQERTWTWTPSLPVGELALALLLILVFAVSSCSDKKQEIASKPFEMQERFISSRSNRMTVYVWTKQTDLEMEFQRKLYQNDYRMNEELEKERDRIYFGANKVLMQLFESAIRSDQAEPANYVSYGLYLRPRQGHFDKALKYIQKGPELEPDNPVYHFILAYAYVAPLQSGQYSRRGGYEEFAYDRYRDKYRIEINRAKKLMPENAFLDYFDALIVYGREDDVLKAWDLILAGNKKPKSYFLFPPPFPALLDTWDTGFAGKVLNLEWAFGNYQEEFLLSLVPKLLEEESIRDDPASLFEVLRFLYRLGITRPFDRVHHYLTGLVVLRLVNLYKEGPDEEKAKAMMHWKKFYDEIGVTLGKWYEQKVKGQLLQSDPKSFLEFEEKVRRVTDVTMDTLGLHLRLLKGIRESLGLSAKEYPLPNFKWEEE